MKISAIILTKNEEQNIQKALSSVSFCDEIIIIDDNSTDKTVEKVSSSNLNVRVIKRELKNDFSSQRNFGEQEAKNDWILFLDADEEVSHELKEELTNIVLQDEIIAYHIKRRDFWWGRELKHGEVRKARNIGFIRLIKKGNGTWKGKAHEEFLPNGKTGYLISYINHFPHPNITSFIQEVNFYSSIRAEELLVNGDSTNIVQIIILPFFKFILNYFIYLGILDGTAGFCYAFFMSFHSFLVRVKLYQYTKMNIKNDKQLSN